MFKLASNMKVYKKYCSYFFIGLLCMIFCGCEESSVGSFAENDTYDWNQVKSISVSLYPPNETIELNDDQMDEAIEWIKGITLGKRDDSYQEVSGQSVQIDVIFDDDSIHTFTILCPYVVVDGNGYKAVNEKLCENINEWANALEHNN